MESSDEAFTRFEFAGWEGVAEAYDRAWSSLTSQFIGPLLEQSDVRSGHALLDVACGTGSLSVAAINLGAVPTGVDFSPRMIALARRRFPGVDFREADAQELPFGDAVFDRLLTNFGMLHFFAPRRACAEAWRVLKPEARFGFTVWAGPAMSCGARLLAEALLVYAEHTVDLPEAPPLYPFDQRDQCRDLLEEGGFDGASVTFETHVVDWLAPTQDFLYEAHRSASVRAGAILAAQSVNSLARIRDALAEGVTAPDSSIPGQAPLFKVAMAAHLVTAIKRA